jgi:outer membrane protein assembly factor BamA
MEYHDGVSRNHLDRRRCESFQPNKGSNAAIFIRKKGRNSLQHQRGSTVIRIWLVLLVVWTLQAESVESRREQIEAARTAKEGNLKPETPPKPQTTIERVQNSVAARLLSGQWNGFGVGFGQLVPGNGFAVGPEYRKSDLLGGKLALAIGARGSSNLSYMGRLDLSLPALFSDRVFLDFRTIHRDISEMPYYGPGPDSRKTGRSDYRLEDTEVELRPGFRPFRHFRAGLIGSFLAVNVGPGHSTRIISTERQFGPNVAPGIDRQTNFWRGGGFVEYDWRNKIGNPSSGGRYSAQYVRFLDADLGRFSFLRLDLDASQYIPLFNRKRVIGLHGASSLTTTNASQTVPFYVQPTLGGPDTLRGFRPFRFYGDNSVMVNAEYRWEASPLLDVVAFADGGKVFNRWEQWNFHRLQSDVGFGLRVKTQFRVAFSVDVGFSHEGFQIWFRANSVF